MNLKKLAENYPKDFFNYAEKILDSYFGNIFITYRNEQILYVNERMANSVHMSKDEITNMSLAELRAKNSGFDPFLRKCMTAKNNPLMPTMFRSMVMSYLLILNLFLMRVAS